MKELTKLNVMIVDDSVVFRHVLSSIISEHGQLNLEAKAINGRYALQKMESHNIDLVFMDIEMPEVNGFEALECIKSKYPNVEVVMISSVNKHNTHSTINAFRFGAFDFIEKPQLDTPDANVAYLKTKISQVTESILSRRGASIRRPVPSPSHSEVVKRASQHVISPNSMRDVGYIIIGVSTGGPKSLMDTIPRIRKDLNVPIFIVQHMPENFTRSLADMLDKTSGVSVKEAEHNEIAKAGHVYIAPGNYHMRIYQDEQRIRIGVEQDAKINSCRPAVDALLYSADHIHLAKPMVIVMTGMGQDGLQGVKALSQPYYCITQSEKSSVIYGMARAIDEAGLSHLSIDLYDLPDLINGLNTRAYCA